METNNPETQTKVVKPANPAPLGLLSFGMTTVLLNIHNVGLTNLTVAIAAMGFALGGLAQFIAGLLEFKNGNTFGGTAFTAYGLFWWSLVFIWWNPIELAVSDSATMGFYFLLWAIFTGCMFIGTLKHAVISRIVFGSLTLLFLLLSISNFADSNVVLVIAGVVGIICGLSAVYNSVGIIINNEYGRKICPLI